MQTVSGQVLSSTRSGLFGLLAVAALFTRFPWSRATPADTTDQPVGALVGWLAAHEPTLHAFGLGFEFLLICGLVYVVLPELYPSKARGLTTRIAFRVSVSVLTTAAAVVVFFVTTGRLTPLALVVLLGISLAVTAGLTGRMDAWQFSTPHVSPAFAVLSSFVSTDRLTEFAETFRRCEVDSRCRLVFQLLLAATTTGFVLVVGVLSALPTLVFPSLELLTFGLVAAAFGRTLAPALPTSWRLRRVRHVQAIRKAWWTTRRVLSDARGTASTLLVTVGLLLGASAAVLSVAVAASAASRTPSFSELNVSVLFSLSSVVIEWLVAAFLLGHAVSVGLFWLQTARRLPSFLAVDRARRSGGLMLGHQSNVTRPSGLLVPQTLLLTAALWSLYPGTLPNADSRPALATALVLLVVTAVTSATSGQSRAQPPGTEKFALPIAFSVQWAGTMLGLSALPGYDATTIVPVTALVIIVALGGFFYVDVRDATHRVGPLDVTTLYLLGLSLVSTGLLHVADDSLLGTLLVWLSPLSVGVVLVVVVSAFYQTR